jgi:lipid II:glycine glycyltransferase (peptidoglycan interpeptide bridge formation enzyme)
VARVGGEVVGGVLMARYAKGAEYLAGYGTEAGRRLGVGQLLLWRALVDVKRRGAEFLDLGGLDPERTPAGIRDFKEGLRGIPYRLAEEVDCLGINPLARLVRYKVGRTLALADGAPS